ncbi:MAG: hypothetical protein MJY79_09000 [Bacteroidaceae bacterium]|nr:hypothetical protein [Bacteroidaceae bacterium]
MIMSLAIGYGIGMLLVHLFGGSGKASAADEPIDKMKMLWAILIAFIALVVSFFTNAILHEAGHMACGLLTGYRFLSFRVLSFTLQKEDDGFHFKKFSYMGTAGQCLMIPPESRDVPYFWYNAGGVLVNLLVCAISGALLRFLDLSAVPMSFCLMFLITGAYMLITNAIPMKAGGIPNDGMNLLILCRHPEQRKYFRNMMAIAAGQSHGQRLIEMPEEWFESEPITKDSTVMNLAGRNLYYSLLIDQFRFEEAHAITEEMLTNESNLLGLYQMEVSCDHLLLELVTKNRFDVVNGLWNRKTNNMPLSKYITVYSKYLPLKCAVLFAYELINNQNADAAQKYYDEVKSRLDCYTQKGEALTALAIMDKIRS